MRLSLLALSLVSANAFAIDVLVVHAIPDPTWQDDVELSFESSGYFTAVDMWDASAINPTLADMQAYDVVVVVPDRSFANNNVLADDLADYVDAGGGVVDAVFSVNWGGLYLPGRWFNDGYRPFEGTFQGNDNLSLVINQPGHPIMNGVSTFAFNNSGYYGPDVAMSPNGDLVASWSNNIPLIATSVPTGAGIVVGFNAYLPSSAVWGNGWDASTDGALLMSNAALYAAGGGVPRFTASASGTCPGAGTVRVANATPNGTVVFASGNPNGSFTIPNGNCAGRSLPLGSPRIRATRSADANGNITINANFGAGVCGASFLAVDVTTCAVTPVATLP